MHWLDYRLPMISMLLATALVATGQTPGCPVRPDGGSVVTNPFDLMSQNGVLRTALVLRSEMLVYLEECFIYQDTLDEVEAPTLRVNPGDRVVLDLTNRLSYMPPAPLQRPKNKQPAEHMSDLRSFNSTNDPCMSGMMSSTSTNIHFHGLNIPPTCHQDEVLNTSIQNTDPPFRFDFQIPTDEPPGMYWYHPHLHGFSTLQVNGGASGALIVGGMEKIRPQVAGLPERVLIVRQQFSDPNSWKAGPYQLTLNFQPALKPALPVIEMKPGAKEALHKFCDIGLLD